MISDEQEASTVLTYYRRCQQQLLTANLQSVQQAFHVITTLQLTAYLWPPQAPVKDGDTFDFIVVGAGSAGCVIAARLVQAGYDVLLIEAGGDPPLESMLPSLASYVPKTNLDWNYTTTDSGQCHREKKIDLYSGKMISGSNGHNYLLYVRGNPYDYQFWTKATNDMMWSYDKVLDFFKKSEDIRDPEILKSPNRIYHGTNGPLKVTKRNTNSGLDGYFDAFAEAGNNVVIDYNAYDTFGYSYAVVSQYKGLRQSTAYAYINPIKGNPNLHMLKKTLATKIIFDELKNTVAVDCLTEDKNSITLQARKEIIVSAGALNSPKLLMLSGIGPNDNLQSMGVEVIADLPVGTNLQDHPRTILLYQMEESNAPAPPPRDPFYPTSDSYFVGFAAVNKSQSYPDYETVNYVYSHDSTDALQTCVGFGLQNDICQQFHDAGKGRTTLFTILALLKPKSRGKVSLKSRNPTEKPSVHLKYFSELSDVEKIVDSIEDFTRVSNTTYFRSVNASLLDVDLPSCRDLEFGSRDYWRCYVQCAVSTSYHYAGTCSMGTVLDSRLRVRYVSRLRVADASAMPVVTSGNTNVPTIMIGEKAAAMIIEDCK